MFLKQQQQSNQHQPNAGNHAMQHSATHNAFEFKGSAAADALPAEFRDLTLNAAQQSQSQSRLKQWTKVPSFDKDDQNDFSRAPGANKQNLSLLTRPDAWAALDDVAGTWSDALASGSGGGDLLKEPSYNLNDMVPEFEPGKPWKGNSQLKSVEDDPHITPASVGRSPLSVNVFSNNWTAGKSHSPTAASSTTAANDSTLSLSSSTWAFTPGSSLYTEPKQSGSGKGYWGDNTSPSDSSLWSSGGSKPAGGNGGGSSQFTDQKAGNKQGFNAGWDNASPSDTLWSAGSSAKPAAARGPPPGTRWPRCRW